jgi:hypothetical protein
MEYPSWEKLVYRRGDKRVRFKCLAVARRFSFLCSIQNGVKLMGSEADHSSTSNVKVKIAWSCTSSLSCIFEV